MNLLLAQIKINILNYFNITKITNKFADLKNFLKLLSPQEQISEIDFMINESMGKILQENFAY